MGAPLYCYFRYELAKQVECSTTLRDHIKARTHYRAHVLPIREGFKGKFTKHGVVRCSYFPSKNYHDKCQYFGIEMIIYPIAEEEFHKTKKSTNRKVYFRGFPLDATEDEVINLFCQFGEIEFVYFMKESKSNKRTNRQGYFIYKDHDQMAALLESGMAFRCRNKKVHYEEFSQQKNISDSSKPMKESMNLQGKHEYISEGLKTYSEKDASNVERNGPDLDLERQRTTSNQLCSAMYSSRYTDCLSNVQTNSRDILNIRINILKPTLSGSWRKVHKAIS